jgi:VIT family
MGAAHAALRVRPPSADSLGRARGGRHILGLHSLRLVPLLPFVVGVRDAFWTAAAATAIVFAAIGALKSRWSTHAGWRSALETLGIGGGAAAVAYGMGAWLRGLVGLG